MGISSSLLTPSNKYVQDILFSTKKLQDSQLRAKFNKLELKGYNEYGLDDQFDPTMTYVSLDGTTGLTSFVF